MSKIPEARHLFHLSVGGGENHRLAIVMAAVIAAKRGYRVHDMTRYLGSPFQPDLVISKSERMVDGAHRRNMTITYYLEVVATHDPEIDWKQRGMGTFDDILKVRIGEEDISMDEILRRIKAAIP